MSECYNCHAKVPEGQGGVDPAGRFVCCPPCVFDPLGCRCKYGEFGVSETADLPFDDYDPDDEAEYEDVEDDGEVDF